MADEPELRREAARQVTRRSGVAVLAVGVGIIVSGALMGRVWWCAAGDLLPWTWDVWSQHCSQHLVDPYTLSHVQHGIGLYLLLTALAGRRLPPSARLLLVALVEAAWEVIENTNWMIDRYRANTVSLNYRGDSILNSLSDYIACVAGALVTIRLPWRVSLSLFIALEAISVVWIRDSLMLNILMLLCPIDAIRQWQAG
jgi:hypothetical protein